jgi:hypothetical protein
VPHDAPPTRPSGRRIARRSALSAVLLLVVAAGGGCNLLRGIQRKFQDGIHVETAGGQHLFQTFDDLAYVQRGDGLLDVTARRASVSKDPSVGQIDQTLWIRQIWRHDPGRSSMDASSTNCLVRYRIQTSRGWARYRGAGAVHCTPTWPRRALRVDLRSATLRQVDGGGQLPDIYGAATFRGRLTAHKDEEAVAAAIAVIEGPKPPVGPPE